MCVLSPWGLSSGGVLSATRSRYTQPQEAGLSEGGARLWCYLQQAGWHDGEQVDPVHWVRPELADANCGWRGEHARDELEREGGDAHLVGVGIGGKFRPELGLRLA